VESFEKTVKSREEIIKNLKKLESYLDGNNREDKDKAKGVVQFGQCFIAYESNGELRFAPSKFTGYANNSLRKHKKYGKERSGGKTNAAIGRVLGKAKAQNKILDEKYLYYCKLHEIKPHQSRSPKSRKKFWEMSLSEDSEPRKKSNKKGPVGRTDKPRSPAKDPYTSDGKPDFTLPEELDANVTYTEGLSVTISVNSYERNNKARNKCIEHHGYDCAACGFNFEENYGDIGREFIHVHHKVPIHTVKEEYEINPEQDLIPVCPNCHAMIHKKNPPLSIRELVKHLKGRHKGK